MKLINSREHSNGRLKCSRLFIGTSAWVRSELAKAGAGVGYYSGWRYQIRFSCLLLSAVLLRWLGPGARGCFSLKTLPEEEVPQGRTGQSSRQEVISSVGSCSGGRREFD